MENSSLSLDDAKEWDQQRPKFNGKICKTEKTIVKTMHAYACKLLYTVSKKNIPQYVFKQLPQSWFNINNFWYKESSHITCDYVKMLKIEQQLRFFVPPTVQRQMHTVHGNTPTSVIKSQVINLCRNI